MGVSSIYKYYRPIMLLCYLLGHFPVANVTSESAENLTFTKSSLPFLMSITGTTMISLLLALTVFVQEKLFAWTAFNIIWTTITYLLAAWITWRAMDIVKAFSIVDRLRNNLDLLPNHLKPLASNPTMFSKAMVVAFALSIFISIGFGLLVSPSGTFVTLGTTAYSVYISFSMFRQCLVLSCILYSCSKVVEDFVRAWHHYCWVNCRPFGLLHDFSQTLMSQTDSLRELDEILSQYVLVLFAFGVSDILVGMHYFISVGMPVATMIMSVTVWNVYLGVLVVCSQLSNMQYDIYAREVLEMAVQDMTWRDYAKVRVLLCQLENSPGEVTASGFFSVKPDLILALLAFGIDCIIFFTQNLSEIQDFHGFSDPSNGTSSTV